MVERCLLFGELKSINPHLHISTHILTQQWLDDMIFKETVDSEIWWSYIYIFAYGGLEWYNITVFLHI